MIRFGSFDVNLSSLGSLACSEGPGVNGILKGGSRQNEEMVSQKIGNDLLQLEQLIDHHIAISTSNIKASKQNSVKILKGSVDSHAASLDSGRYQPVSNNNIQKDADLNFKIHSQRSINSSASSKALMAVKLVKRARRLGGCTRCFSLDHNCFECHEGIRCAACFNYGHKFKLCSTESRPRIQWRPKKPLCEQPTTGNEEAKEAETEESPPSAISLGTGRSYDERLSHIETPSLGNDLDDGDDGGSPVMANFAVNPEPFIPVGLELEDWARPARGRIIISGNPPRCHEENELLAVDQLAEAAVVNAVAAATAASLGAQIDLPQHSTSVSSETRAFLRAQGPPVTLELPLPEQIVGASSADRQLQVSNSFIQSFESDYQIRSLANRLQLHSGFGPAPSVEMLLGELAMMASEVYRMLPMKSLLLVLAWNILHPLPPIDPWMLFVDNPNWKNNSEASTSSGIKTIRLMSWNDSPPAQAETMNGNS